MTITLPVALILVVVRKECYPHKKQNAASTRLVCEKPVPAVGSITRKFNLAVIDCIVQPCLSNANTAMFSGSKNNLNITQLINSFVDCFG